MNIFVVEDDDNIRELVMYALESAGFEVTGFESGEVFFSVLRHTLPHLVLLDIMLPNQDGLSILKQMRENKRTEQVPVIMLTAKNSELDRVRGLDFGADDYMTKPFSVLELVSRVKAVMRRSNYTEKEKSLTIDEVLIQPEKRKVLVRNNSIELTYKEFEILHLLMKNQGVVMSREKILELIWDDYYIGETRTVDIHINTLRKKLEPASIIKTVRGVGYKIGD